VQDVEEEEEEEEEEEGQYRKTANTVQLNIGQARKI